MKTILLSAFLLYFITVANARIIYVEPVRDAKYVSINNNIIIGFDENIIITDLKEVIKVKGSVSGNHTGEIIQTPDRKKIIFKPDVPFAFNELVEVRLNHIKTSFHTNSKLTYSFLTQISRPVWDGRLNDYEESGDIPGHGYSYPDSYGTLPALTVNIYNNPSPGHLILSNYANVNYPSNLIIANNDGTIFYSREMAATSVDYSRQPNGLLTYYSFLQSPLGILNGKYFAEDSQFNIVDSFYCGNGYSTDTHELRVLNNGHALLMSYDPQTVDMSKIVTGGDSNATVIGLIIQEIDVNKNVVFQWRSWDHYDITDAIYQDLTGPVVDPVHGNAIEYDNDGNLLISSRHLNEITKVSRATGEMIWRMGGVHNQFTFVNDTIPFHYQHHIRRIPNGNITMFDNGNFRTTLFSRAVEYHLDEVQKIATLKWQYINNPVIYGASRGSVQRLVNGNTLICWGGVVPTLTEVTPSGDVALQMSFPAITYSYRVMRDEVNLTLNVKIAIEGYYNSKSDMLNIKDTVRVYVRAVNSPFSIIDSAKSVVDSVNFNANLRYYNVPEGMYYLSTKHRNGLETWSKSGGELFLPEGVYQYDFTSSGSNAYGNNLKLKGSKYCIYSGDVNQDENINKEDVLFISENAAEYHSGYASADLNGDKITDITDMLICFNNSRKSVSVLRP